jgi:hypothetical protein
VITSIKDQSIIDKLLKHLQDKGALSPPPELLPATRASPPADWSEIISLLGFVHVQYKVHEGALNYGGGFNAIVRKIMFSYCFPDYSSMIQ